MKSIWSYIIMALCMFVTSARNLDYRGNGNGFQDDLTSAIADEETSTPPSASGYIIDSNGYLGNSNEATPGDLKNGDLPPLFSEALATLFNSNEKFKYDAVPFTKEDITKLENSHLCNIMCGYGVKKPPCKC